LLTAKSAPHHGDPAHARIGSFSTDLASLAGRFMSASPLSQGNGGTGEGGNSAFADPDEKVNIFGFDQGPQPSGLNGSVQVGPQQGQLTPFKHFQINSLTSPPDPLSRPSN
jgi:hypothetical protein